MCFEKFQPCTKHCLVLALTVGVLAVPEARYLASWSLGIFYANELKTFAVHYRVNITLLRHLGLIFILIFDLIGFSSVVHYRIRKPKRTKVGI